MDIYIWEVRYGVYTTKTISFATEENDIAIAIELFKSKYSNENIVYIKYIRHMELL